jgi:hypothetical protein
MRRNFLKAGFGRQRLMSDIPGSVPWILTTLLAVLVALPFTNLPRPTRVESPPPPANVVNVETRIAAEGQDSHQRSLPFTVYVLAEQLSWKLKSETDLEGGQTLLSPELTVAINGARDVFCVGTASFEGLTPAEEERAAQRAAQLAEWVGAVVRSPGQTSIFALNAGQYQGPSELDSVYQRKAILIITGPHDDQVDLSEGLTSGLEQQQQAFPIVYSLLHHYSRSNQWLKVLKRPGEAAGRRNRSAHGSWLVGSRRVRR